MAISKTQPMREAEIELVDTLNQTNEDLTAEIARAQAAENANASAISAETTRAQAAEGTISEAVSANASDITALENSFSTIPVIEYGQSATINLAASGNLASGIAFANEKETPPVVICILEDVTTSPISRFARQLITIYNVTELGFSYTIENPSTTDAIDFKINWLALGA